MNNLPNSTDGVVSFISDITNKGITLSKGSGWLQWMLVLWRLDLIYK